MASTRLDMQHGFMKSIIKNQVDRDNYDKEVKAKLDTQGPSKYRSHKHKPRKPEKPVYMPPFTKKEFKQFLFVLEFEDRNGQTHIIDIFKEDSAQSLAEELGATCNLHRTHVTALAHRIQEEIDKRL